MLYLIFSVILGLIPVNKHYIPLKEGTAIWVERKAMHTELILPSKMENMDWLQYLDDENAKDSGHYISFGWGDRGWYLNGGQTNIKVIPIALNALFLPSKSVMHINVLRFTPAPSSKRVKIFISKEQLSLLNQYIFNSFEIDNQKNIFVLATHETIRGYGKFYNARGKYHVLFNSNHWTNMIIKKMGIRSPVWAPFPHAIMFHLKHLEH